MDDIERRLIELGIALPALTPARGNFALYARHGKTIYLSGKGAPLRELDHPALTIATVRRWSRKEASVDDSSSNGGTE